MAEGLTRGSYPLHFSSIDLIALRSTGTIVAGCKNILPVNYDRLTRGTHLKKNSGDVRKKTGSGMRSRTRFFYIVGHSELQRTNACSNLPCSQ